MARAETEETYLTVAEVAEMLKLNQQTVRNWIDQGSLPALRVGRRVRIKRSDFDRILEESYSGRAAPSTSEPAASAAAAPGHVAAPSNTAPPSDTASPGDPAVSGANASVSAQDFWDGEPVGIPEPAPAPDGNGRSL